MLTRLGLVLALVFGASCGGSPEPSEPVRALNGWTPVEEANLGDIVRFWGQFDRSNADEAELADSIDGMARSASAVVVGSVEAVREGRTFVGDVADDTFTYMELVVRVEDVVAGTLPIRAGETLVLEELGTRLATGSSLTGATHLLFVRAKGEPRPGVTLAGPLDDDRGRFRLLSSQGVVIGTSQGLRNPLLEAMGAQHDPIARELETIPSFEVLVERVRAARSG